MVNTKGGFLVEDGKEVDENLIRKEKEREKQRAMQNLEPRKSQLKNSGVLACLDSAIQRYTSTPT